MSQIASYQYPDNAASEALTNGGVTSPFVSYQFTEDFSTEALTGGGILSPFASYQYFEWPGSGVLRLDSSLLVSYFYPFGGGGSGVSFSQAEVSPSSLPADGHTPATVTVTLLDANGSPLSGRQVTVSAVLQLASGGAGPLSTVIQPAGVTDSSGRAAATLTSARAGTALISATDVTDGVALGEQPKVQFVSALVAPGQDLADAIAALAGDSGKLLTQSLAADAADEGQKGDTFWNRAGQDAVSMGISVIGAVASAMFDAAGPADAGDAVMKLTTKQLTEKVAQEIAEQLDEIIAFGSFESALNTIESSSSGLSTYAKAVSDNNATLQQAELSAEQGLLAGIPPSAAGLAASYVTDLALRTQANDVIGQVAAAQDGLVDALMLESDSSRTTWLKWLFIGVDIATAAADAFVPGSSALVSPGATAVQVESAARSLTLDVQGYNSAYVALMGDSYLSSIVDANTKAAFDAISLGQPPAPVTGKIVSADSRMLYTPASGIVGSVLDWFSSRFANTTLAQPVGANSTITIANTGAQAAQFAVYAFFTNTIDLINDAGMIAGTAKVPIVAARVATIPAGQSEPVTFDYFDNPTGGIPDAGSEITFYVLGSDGTGGLFFVGETSSTMLWQQAGGAVLGGHGRPRGPRGPVPLDGSTNLVPIETFIRCVAYQNPNNQTYQAQIWVVNPFAIPLLARVTQPLPPGLTVVSTDGVLQPDTIVWTNSVATNGLAEQSFSFTLPVPPGAVTNLPPPTLVLSDSTGTNSLTQTAVAASFMGLFPVGVSNFIPTGTWGAGTAAQLAVTNFTTASEAGSLLISLADSNGSAVTNFSMSFSVDGQTATNLAYTLPGGFAPGAYAITGVLSMGGGSRQVFSGTYLLEAAPVWLGPGPATGVLSDGFTLQLEGTPGYGYLIQCSTNLLDWQPAEYLVLTNSTGHFTDYYAPLYSERFYRAIQVSTGP
ncbi:MAG TPA: Ig-like domain-containing protein [Dongiaceae bacterium]|nr:Ig-like domain-containing protein [Dongiaceae bacterium]